ncbi:MAG: 16S rRNA (adenine(1518)-N(6)/adenine(1519)-N(6))-dimethyltransferase RsmA [Bacteroidota bacterium]
MLPDLRPVTSDLRPKKSLGQHFLHDRHAIARIVAALAAAPDDPVLEIGPGTGALTGPLAERFPRLVALEVDQRAIDVLRAELPDLDVRHADVLDADWGGLAAELDADEHGLTVVGNLPYYITSPILFALLGARLHLRRAVVMMQKEVAERLVAEPRTKAYGILSVQLQLWARPSYLFTVKPGAFSPPPKVDSAVVALDFAGIDEPDADEDRLRSVVRTAFGQRRKMLRSSLKALARQAPGSIPESMQTLRPEALAPSEFVTLTRALFG